jgi:RNA polymerase sigma factor (sigma-70 family)
MDTRTALSDVFREEAGPLVGSLVRLLGDFDLAEEAVQEAIIEALEHWPRSGVPDKPGAWLTATARRKAIDRLRREKRLQSKLVILAAEPAPVSQTEPDERLKLLFTCCHPALSRDAQVALTLRAVAGLTTPQVARAFLLSEATLAQRIVRAKRKIVAAGIPYRVPSGADLNARLAEVLAVLYLMFNEGYLSTEAVPERRELARDAEWLVGLVARLLPAEPEPLGLLALMRLHLARAVARFDGEGRMVLLQDQDRTRWDRDAIAAAGRQIAQAAAMKRAGPYQLQAAIAAVHAESPSWEATDWPQVLGLYEILLRHLDTPVVRLNRAIALWHLAGPGPALVEIEPLASRLDGYHLYHATRGELLRRLGREEEARAEHRRALELTANPAERELQLRRLANGG